VKTRAVASVAHDRVVVDHTLSI